MVGALRGAYLRFETHNLDAVFAQRAVHIGPPFDALKCALQKNVRDVLMNTEVARFQHFKPWILLLQGVSSGIDALHKQTVKKKIRKDDDPAVPEFCSSDQTISYSRSSCTGVTNKR